MSDDLSNGSDLPPRQNSETSTAPEVTPSGPLGWLVGSIQGVLLAMLGAVVTMMTNIISGLIQGMIPGGAKGTDPEKKGLDTEDS